MIRFEDVIVEGSSSLSFDITEGSICKIITHSDYAKTLLLDTLFGFRRPISGTVLLVGHDLYALPDKEVIRLFARIGVVWRYGGGLSHLKVWENITLPTWYHRGIKPEDLEDQVVGLLGRAGKESAAVGPFLAQNTGSLPIQEKRLVALARALLMGPDLIIYDSLFEGLDRVTAESWAQLTMQFHSDKPLRTSVYVSSEEKSFDTLRADLVLRPALRGEADEDRQGNGPQIHQS